MPISDNTSNGRVIWITGLSGAGKTTLARAMLKQLPGAILLDGDELREVLGALKCGFDTESRKKLAQTYACLARLLARQGQTVIVSTISLFHDIHAWNRKNLPGYFEVFLNVSEDVLRKRDAKGLYAKEQTGEVLNMVGSRLTAEFPEHPHIILNETVPIEKAVQSILAACS